MNNISNNKPNYPKDMPLWNGIPGKWIFKEGKKGDDSVQNILGTARITFRRGYEPQHNIVLTLKDVDDAYLYTLFPDTVLPAGGKRGRIFDRGSGIYHGRYIDDD